MKKPPIKTKLGRPKTEKREVIKSRYLRVRLTPKEVSQINEISKKSFEKNHSETIRNLIFSKPISVQVIKPEFDNILGMLKKIASNCEYILNYKRKNLDDILPAIKRMQEVVNELNEKIKPMDGIRNLQLLELADKEKSLANK